MPQFNDIELTAAVLQSFEEVKNPRVKFLMEELTKSLHEFVRKTDLTFGEWDYAIDFLTRVGQKCTPSRQEFILLSDVLGVSMLVDAVNHREREGATETTVLGQFYVGEHKAMPHGTDVSPSLEGEKMFVQGRVTDLNGKPLANVPVDIWHADDDGFSGIDSALVFVGGVLDFLLDPAALDGLRDVRREVRDGCCAARQPVQRRDEVGRKP